jgi:hypothetical protein
MIDCCVPSCKSEFDSSTTAQFTVCLKAVADYILESIALVVIEGNVATLGEESAIERDCFKI